MRLQALLCLAVLAPAVPAAAQEQATDVLEVADYLDFERVADPQISPDGSQIVYTRRWVNTQDDSWDSALWIMNADGSRNRFLTEGSSARWSPDGTRILYLAEGEPKGNQLFVRWMDAEGATSQVTRVDARPRSPEWSPDGKSIGFVMVVPAKPKWKVDLPGPPEGAKWTPAPRVVERLHYRRDRVGFTEPGFMHLFVVTADGGTPRQLTRGEWHVGARFDGYASGANFDWTPDGRSIVFDGLTDTDGDDEYRRAHIYAIDVASGAIRTLTSRNGLWMNPIVSPDGRQVAFIGYELNDHTYTMARLWTMAIDGAGMRLVTESYDRPPSSIHWAPDGRGVYFRAQDEGSVNLQYVSLDGDVRPVTQGPQVMSLTSLATDRDVTAVGVRSAAHEPGDVVRFSLRRRGEPVRLTAVNDDLLQGRELGELEELWYTSSGGQRVQGWIVKPPHFDPAKRYPMIMEIHGGPFSMYTVGFRFFFQAFAAQDYVVLYTNPRGSTGYGEAFTRGIDHAYPSVDYDDLMAGVDAAIAQGFVDSTRMYVGGCSGGGVLSSWVIGHTDRFAAAAVRCPVINWLSFAGQTDIPYFTHSFFHEPFWQAPEQWLAQSSLMFVGNVTTPTVVMTGELDLRTPMPQSEEYFAALKMRGVPTTLLRFNGEYHGTTSKPSNFMRTVLYMVSWYEQHTRGGGQAAAEAGPRDH